MCKVQEFILTKWVIGIKRNSLRINSKAPFIEDQNPYFNIASVFSATLFGRTKCKNKSAH